MRLLVFLQARVVIQRLLLQFMQFLPVGINRLLVVGLVSQGYIIGVNLGGLIEGGTIRTAVVYVGSRAVLLRIFLRLSRRLIFQTFGARNQQRSENTDVNQLFLHDFSFFYLKNSIIFNLLCKDTKKITIFAV